MISLIVAKSKNNVIGNKNKMPWHIPLELQYFKKITSGHTVIMGKNTLLSIGKALPNRKNIVLTTNPSFFFEGVICAASVSEALSFVDSEEEVFIIGGKQTYEQFLPYVQKMYITEIDLVVEGDTFFPEINFEEWSLLSSEKGLKNKENNVDYYFNVFVKR